VVVSFETTTWEVGEFDMALVTVGDGVGGQETPAGVHRTHNPNSDVESEKLGVVVLLGTSVAVAVKKQVDDVNPRTDLAVEASKSPTTVANEVESGSVGPRYPSE